jgi:hypothetical protein
MRIVVLILLLANVALLAYLDHDAQRTRDQSAVAAQQVKPERIRLMTAQEVAALQPAASVCLEIGPLDTATLAKARQAIEVLQPVPRMTERRDQANVFLQIRDVPDGMRARVKEIAAGFGGTELRLCPTEKAAG